MQNNYRKFICYKIRQNLFHLTRNRNKYIKTMKKLRKIKIWVRQPIYFITQHIFLVDLCSQDGLGRLLSLLKYLREDILIPFYEKFYTNSRFIFSRKMKSGLTFSSKTRCKFQRGLRKICCFNIPSVQINHFICKRMFTKVVYSRNFTSD